MQCPVQCPGSPGQDWDRDGGCSCESSPCQALRSDCPDDQGLTPITALCLKSPMYFSKQSEKVVEALLHFADEKTEGPGGEVTCQGHAAN